MSEESTELTVRIYLYNGIPDVEIGTAQNKVPFYLFAKSPMLAELSPEQATQWASQLRIMAEQFDRWAQEMQPQVCFPTTGMEEV